jgi:hypothetical protein
MSDEQNPYLPPDEGSATEVVRETPATRTARPLVRIAGWNAAAASNMVFCGIAGWAQTVGSGRQGMLMGCLFILVIGSLMSYLKPQFAKVMTSGAIPLCLSQFFPILQMISGMFAVHLVTSMGLSEEISPGVPSQISNQPGAFLATCLTAAPMLIICGAVGLTIGWLGRILRGGSSASV